jgi:hypothetical protein
MTFQSDSIVIVCFPTWAGGKFLINCLSLSNDCYLQDAIFVKHQRAGNLTPYDKFKLFDHELDLILTKDQITTDKLEKWNDLRLGCEGLFDTPTDPSTFNPIIEEIAKEPKLFFVVAHSIDKFRKLIEIWPNARIIFFQENDKFIQWRTKTEDTTTNFRSGFEQIDNMIPWNANDYLDSDVFITKIEQLYKQLLLTDFNKKLISNFYSKYMSTLEFLSYDNTH